MLAVTALQQRQIMTMLVILSLRTTPGGNFQAQSNVVGVVFLRADLAQGPRSGSVSAVCRHPFWSCENLGRDCSFGEPDAMRPAGSQLARHDQRIPAWSEHQTRRIPLPEQSPVGVAAFAECRLTAQVKSANSVQPSSTAFGRSPLLLVFGDGQHRVPPRDDWVRRYSGRLGSTSIVSGTHAEPPGMCPGRPGRWKV